MREMKFRGWDKELGMMVYSDEHTGCIYYNTNPVRAINIILNEDDYGYTYMQYIGLKDRGNTEIYEGDILGGIIGHGIVYWDKDRAGFGINCNGELDEVRFEELSKRDLWVIGNIYQDPELLEVK